jgi:hypothetical protein
MVWKALFYISRILLNAFVFTKEHDKLLFTKLKEFRGLSFCFGCDTYTPNLYIFNLPKYLPSTA